MRYHSTVRWGPWILHLLHNTKPVFMCADSNRESEVTPFTYKRTNNLVVSVISCNTITLQLTFPSHIGISPIVMRSLRTYTFLSQQWKPAQLKALMQATKFSEHFPNPKALCAESGITSEWRFWEPQCASPACIASKGAGVLGHFSSSCF